MRAVLKNYRQSPRKVRLVGDLIKGRSVDEALLVLDHTPKRGAVKVKKLVESALANAGKRATELVVESVRVDEGITLKRFRPVWRGMAHPIRKRTSRVVVELKEKKEKTTPKK